MLQGSNGDVLIFLEGMPVPGRMQEEDDRDWMLSIISHCEGNQSVRFLTYLRGLMNG